MFNSYKTGCTGQARQSWREYQASLKQNSSCKNVKRTAIKLSVLFSLMFILACGVFTLVGGTTFLHSNSGVTDERELLSKEDVKDMLGGMSLANIQKESFNSSYNGVDCLVSTTIDVPIQRYLLHEMDRSNSMNIGIVMTEPVTGRVLVMAGFDDAKSPCDPCVGSFPAASIFKIVTAAAAIEKCGLSSTSVMTFNGGKYTLYKSQLKDRKNKYTNRISFGNSFAQSVNPVFGKLGMHSLGRISLEKYADAFGFNRNIDFEVPLAQSCISLSDEPYRHAEIASGFNRETRISPLHGAMLVSAVVNQGELVEPTIIDQIVDMDGQRLYSGSATAVNRAINSETSSEIKKLMMETITSGTCKKEFRNHKKSLVLSKLNIGGKTGTISSREIRDVRYDWFVGFAEEKEGRKKIALSVMVAHRKYLGKRAAHYARIAIEQYFQNNFVKNDIKHVPTSSS